MTPTAEQVQQTKRLAPVMVGIGLVMLVMGGQLLSLFAIEAIKISRMGEGRIADATITDKGSVLTSNPDDATCWILPCTVRYEFVAADDQAYSARQRVNFVTWEDAFSGQQVLVRYAADNPSVNLLETEDGQLVPICGGLIVLAGVVTLLAGWSAIRTKMPEERLS